MNHSRTIQAKFSALSVEADTFRREADKATQERLRVEQELQALHAKQKEITNQIRVGQDALGSFDREKAALLNEKKRLDAQLQQERTLLEQCCAESDALVSEEVQAKQEFVKELSQANKDLSDLLLGQEDRRLRSLLSVQTVPALLATIQEVSSPDSSDSSSGSELEAAIASLKEETEAYNRNLEHQKHLEEQIATFRQRFLSISASGKNQVMCRRRIHSRASKLVSPPSFYSSEPQSIAEEQLNELESVWSQNREDEEDSDPNSRLTNVADVSPVHLQLFYGTEKHEENMDVEGSGDVDAMTL